MDTANQTTAPVEGSGLPVAPSVQSNPSDAASLAVKAGGLRGGRARKDGLVPGSPEAIAADKKRDAERKKLARKGSLPPPLPAANVATGKVDAHQATPVSPAAVPWDTGTLAPLFAQIVPAIEKWSADSLAEQAAKIPGAKSDFVEEVRTDAKWNPAAKAGIVSAAPQVAAKWLNKTGIPSDAAPEIVLATSIVAIFVSHNMLKAKLESMGKQNEPTPPPQNPDNP